MPRIFPIPRWIAIASAVVLALGAALYAYLRVEQFLIRDTRFTLNGPGAEDSLQIAGAAHVPAQAIQAVFNEDYGRSAYLIPLEERRTSLRTVAWVKDASVARFWPNHLLVGVTERKPVAFLPAAAGKPWLIDSDGVILPPVEDRFTLPILIGVHASDAPEQRRKLVGKLISLMKDLGPAGAAASVVDVSDPDDLKVSEPFDGRSVTLLLGDRDFALRHDNFVRYYAEIRKKMPGAIVLDLRVEDRITVVPQKGPE
jgi:cell division protein FtsQ